MSLRGTVPSGLNDSLTQLAYLNLENNNLSGPVPSLANLTFLQTVFLDNNNFNSIPHACFHALTSLNLLSLNNNTKLSAWNFPTDLTAHSSQLQQLDLSSTNLMGSLPNISHSFPTIVTLDLSNNNLSSIPEGCFHNLTYLTHLSLSNNTNLQPWTFPNLTQSTKLNELNLVATNLMGSLPSDIFESLPSLQTLVLSNNSLIGVLPQSFGGSKIATLHLNNQKGSGLSGPIDVLSSMIDLSQVWLQWNSFTGPIPDLSRCTDSGPIPKSSNGSVVNFGVNTTNGFCHKDPGRPCDHRVTILLEIAADFKYPILLARTWKGNNPCKGWSFITCHDKSRIRTVNLSNLKLTGTISSAFANLTDLQELYLDGNNLTGEIPEPLTSLPQLELLNVSNNHLVGNIPKFSPKVKVFATGNDFSNGSHHRPNRISTPLITGILSPTFRCSIYQ
ncbi:hypothetical protein PIB30_021236 [Stylosanthes scabra]|uniref:Uncharacterized protein n=1 Tax=Stylosanthes scabra TaxID=79078 RepID=A0ABU6VAE3_9FABA|nr:hypothetical protein [Stylosanthes scabra]